MRSTQAVARAAAAEVIEAAVDEAVTVAETAAVTVADVADVAVGAVEADEAAAAAAAAAAAVTDSPEKTVTRQRDALTEGWRSRGTTGIGIDVCPWARMNAAPERWRGRAERVFSPQELQEFQGELALPWAAREAVIKAFGMPSVLGAPLAEMNIRRSPVAGRLFYDPKGEARVQLQQSGQQLDLRWWTFAGVAVVLALRRDPDDPRGAFCSIRVTTKHGATSSGARAAAEQAARVAALEQQVAVRPGAWSGGKSRAPAWSGLPAGMFSVSHDGACAGAAVVLPDPC